MNEYLKQCLIEVEVIESTNDHCHKIGDKYVYPDEFGDICVWLRDAIEPMIKILALGGTLPWTYEGTKYKKKFNKNGVTTEYVRCPDPTEKGIVVKITKTEKQKNSKSYE